jgi:hypothetical protein
MRATSTLKRLIWPSSYRGSEELALLDLLRLCLQLVNVPIDPHKLSPQKRCLGTRNPDAKVRRKKG